jgi:hypothetical protein
MRDHNHMLYFDTDLSGSPKDDKSGLVSNVGRSLVNCT